MKTILSKLFLSAICGFVIVSVCVFVNTKPTAATDTSNAAVCERAMINHDSSYTWLGLSLQLPSTASAASRPVIFIHGWNGSPMQDTANKIMKQFSNGQIQPFVFDYSEWSANWPTNPNIAPCLADYVNAVSDAYKQSGGDGKVILVAHSMGGIAIRYATDKRYVNKPIPGEIIPYIITLDTPYLGSPLGGGDIAKTIEMTPSLFGGGASHGGTLSSNGSKCLAKHANIDILPNGCGNLQPLPKGIDLTQIAGNVTVIRSIFGLPLYKIPLNNDGIVPVPSQQGYQDSTSSSDDYQGGTTLHIMNENCSVDSGALVAASQTLMIALFPINLKSFMFNSVFDYITLQDLQNDKLNDVEMSYYFAVAQSKDAKCGHSSMLTNQSTMNKITEVIKGALTKLQANDKAATKATPSSKISSDTSVSPSTSSNTTSPSDSDNSDTSSIINSIGNTAGNIENIGTVVGQGDWVYYAYSGNIYKVRTNGNDRVALNSGSPGFINVIGNWIYYTNGNDNNYIYKIDINGNNKTILNSDRSYAINVIGDWIYYQADNNILYKMRTDGTGKTIIASDGLDCDTNNGGSISLGILGDWIYYTNHNDNGYIYKININGDSKTRLGDVGSCHINIIGDWIYYINTNDFNIYKIHINGGEAIKLGSESAYSINVVGDWIYYINAGDNRSLYKILTDGTNKTKLNSDPVYNINLIDDWIYYGSYKIHTDGTGRQLVQ